jgi:phospholipase C
MNFRCRFLLSVSVLWPALFVPLASAQAQLQPGMFSHVIIIVQENRTPDNIFGVGAAGPSGCTTQAPFMPGVDIVSGGQAIVAGQTGLICNTSLPMNAGFDPNHSNTGFQENWDKGKMDGFCAGAKWPNCPAYSYVQSSDVQPYLNIASTYGFANYMFQTNQGASFAAHQFLFTGTSAPTAPHDANNYYWDFVRTNPPFDDSGCNLSGASATWVTPNEKPLAAKLPAMCYAHDSLVTGSNCVNGVCDKPVSWTYYSPTPAGVIWNAPAVIPEVCYGVNSTANAGSACGSVGAEWAQHLKFYSIENDTPIFSDIANCQLPQISWVIPDMAWSDHPVVQGVGTPALGPGWVSNIVNQIGASYTTSNGKCDYWGTNLPPGEAQPTAIFVVWDDWGGFYDHVPPPNLWVGAVSGKSWTCPAPNQWGCGYTYGFRVPLLVVSEYTGTFANGSYNGYVSGACGVEGQPNCPNNKYPYIHDFGSILAFTEFNFDLPAIDLADKGYADYNALDWDEAHSIPPLSDFFQLYGGSGSVGRPFVQIPTVHPESIFRNYYSTHHATGPDTD